MTPAARLAYGAYARRLDTASAKRCGAAYYPLSPAPVRWFCDTYLQGHGLGDPPAEPLRARLEALPPLVIFARSEDTILDECVDPAAAAAAGVPHVLNVRPGLVHGSLQLAETIDRVVVMIERMARFGRRHLGADR